MGKLKGKVFDFFLLLLSLSCSFIWLCRESSLPQQIQIIIKKLFVLFCRFVVFLFSAENYRDIHVGMWKANDIEAHIRALGGSVANMNGILGMGKESKRQQKLRAIHEHVLFGREKQWEGEDGNQNNPIFGAFQQIFHLASLIPSLSHRTQKPFEDTKERAMWSLEFVKN